MSEQEEQTAIRFSIIFDAYFDGLRSWDECEEELAQDARYYHWLYGNADS